MRVAAREREREGTRKRENCGGNSWQNAFIRRKY